ncbi:MAG: Coenzyme F420 hydrogenase/dehydrogenase, beta subunit C-terminal domain [Limnohabitans sp.]|jgi:coenzyme F420 hydrogenase subunit beta|nr:Coenzyme F420 hydrogenase/dehydrogenase, beta subunit C-terminal domain [Limnohabitans sp.]
MRIATIKAVAEAQLCTGCGLCSSMAPDRYRMADVLDHGRRPIPCSEVREDAIEQSMVQLCPGVNLSHDRSTWSSRFDPTVADAWGPVLEVWKGHAVDSRSRWEGSSGGIATAIAMHAVHGAAGGVLHIRSRRGEAWLNETVLSRTPEDVRAAAGSRYAPASPVDSIHLAKSAEHPVVFIGKPCDAAAVHALAQRDKAVADKVALTVAIFCAGTPTWRGTLEMLRAMGFDDPTAVESLRYRGHGWPGSAAARGKIDGQEVEVKFSYDESWNRILQKHRQWRCYICPDHTGEFADISVGDPWHEPPKEGAEGESLIVVRTERGARWLQSMRDSGLLNIVQVANTSIAASQPNLLGVRANVWGRILALRLGGAATPRFVALPSFKFWLSVLSLREKAQSIIGTLRRIGKKGLRRAAAMVPMHQNPSR